MASFSLKGKTKLWQTWQTAVRFLMVCQANVRAIDSVPIKNVMSYLFMNYPHCKPARCIPALQTRRHSSDALQTRNPEQANSFFGL